MSIFYLGYEGVEGDPEVPLLETFFTGMHHILPHIFECQRSFLSKRRIVGYCSMFGKIQHGLQMGSHDSLLRFVILNSEVLGKYILPLYQSISFSHVNLERETMLLLTSYIIFLIYGFFHIFDLKIRNPFKNDY